MAVPGLLEGQRNQPKPHADLFSEVMVKATLQVTPVGAVIYRGRIYQQPTPQAWIATWSSQLSQPQSCADVQDGAEDNTKDAAEAGAQDATKGTSRPGTGGPRPGVHRGSDGKNSHQPQAAVYAFVLSPVIPIQHTPGPANHAFWLQLRPLCELHISLQPPNSNSGPGGRDRARPCMWACSQRQLEAAFTCFWRWPCGVCVGRWAKGKAYIRTRGCPPVSIAHRRPKLKPIRSTVPCALVPGSPWT